MPSTTLANPTKADIRLGSSSMLATRAAIAAAGARACDRLVYESTDRTGATAALWAAAEATVDFSGSARLAGVVDRAAHIAIAQHVAGTDDHRERGRTFVRVWTTGAPAGRQMEKTVFTPFPICCRRASVPG